MSPKTPSFHSKALNQSIQQAAPTFNEYLGCLDAISKDIKDLEGYLRDKGITFFHTHPVGPHIYEDKTSFITWQHCESAKKFRLFYTVMPWSDQETENLNGDVEWEKPLIETEKEIRLRVFPVLPDFVTSLSRELEVFQGKFVSNISENLKF